MPVLRQRIVAKLAVPRTHGDHRDLAAERDEGFEDQRCVADRCPRGIGVGGRTQHSLALSVVTKTPRLQHRRQSDRFDRAREIFAAVYGRKRGRGKTDLAKEILFGQTILRQRERARIRKHLRVLGQPLRRFRGNVLEIERGDIDAPRKFGERIEVAPVRAQQRRDFRARVGSAVDDQKALPERRTREREHARELAAAENAYRGHGRTSCTLMKALTGKPRAAPTPPSPARGRGHGVRARLRTASLIGLRHLLPQAAEEKASDSARSAVI